MKNNKYFAYMKVNGTTTSHIEGINKKELAKRIAQSAKSNVFMNNLYSWKVWNEDGIIVAAGGGKKTENGYIYASYKELIGERI